MAVRLRRFARPKRRDLTGDDVIGCYSVRDQVRLPKGENINDWIAINLVDFFNELSLLWGVITDVCTDESCPKMTAGSKYEYLWIDGKQYSAPKYVDLLMTWTEHQINENEVIFPKDESIPFPDEKSIYPQLIVYGFMRRTEKEYEDINHLNQIPLDIHKVIMQYFSYNLFRKVTNKILSRLFRIYAHLYHHHIKDFVKLDCEAHLNTCLKHFYYFVKEFKLVSDKEMKPLKDTIVLLTAKEGRGQRYRPKYQYT